MAIVILIAYLAYLYFSNKKNPMEWSELVDSARLINQNLSFGRKSIVCVGINLCKNLL